VEGKQQTGTPHPEGSRFCCPISPAVECNLPRFAFHSKIGRLGRGTDLLHQHNIQYVNEGEWESDTAMARRIMVVDDQEGALTLIGIMLERGGFEVVKARDAYSALDLLKNVNPDLIILDVMMPGMDGIELCRQLRADSATQTTPILLLSARHDNESVAKGMKAGADDYLSKPILHHDLLTKIHDVLGPE
jgi:PleD family two-component response regulator